VIGGAEGGGGGGGEGKQEEEERKRETAGEAVLSENVTVLQRASNYCIFLMQLNRESILDSIVTSTSFLGGGVWHCVQVATES
jgi:hypothetical protein